MAELIGQGPVGLAGGTTIAFAQTSPTPMILGTRAKDAAGNEYIFCDATDTVNPGQPVSIDSAFRVAPLAVTGRGPIGVACVRATSDQCLWVQIYGRVLMQIIDGGNGTAGTQASPSDAANGPTTLSTSVPTVFCLSTSLVSPHSLLWVSGNASTASGIYVEGMVVATDASPGSVTATTGTTGTTLAHTGGEIGVFLNYPFLQHRNYGE